MKMLKQRLREVQQLPQKYGKKKFICKTTVFIAMIMIATVLGACGDKTSVSHEIERETVDANEQEKDITEVSQESEIREDEDASEEDAGRKEEEEKASKSESNGKDKSKKESKDAVNPELKAFLDEYEDFIDDYIDFMVKYQNSDDTVEMLSDYMEIMGQYAEYTETVQDYKPDEMSDADASYYLEVTNRISKKLLKALK